MSDVSEINIGFLGKTSHCTVALQYEDSIFSPETTQRQMVLARR
jgi:hypothetical protein